MNDDYLWDRSGEPDPEVQRLESLLSRYRSTRPPLVLARRRARPLVWAGRMAMAAAVLVGAFAAYLALLPKFGQPGSEWKVTARTGTPSIEGALLRDAGALRLGEALRTDGASRAEIRAGSVGRIEVEPNSVLRLVRSGGNRHRLALERGRIRARLWSPPFTFSFETPAGTAFDLGCAFTLEAEENGGAILHVTSGWVDFQWNDRQELIPAGATAIAMRGAGPGTAFFDDASDAFKSALREIDFGPADHHSALERALGEARARDAYSLLRLSIHLTRAERGLIYDRAAALAPPPQGITRDSFIQREPDVLDRWVDSLGLGSAKRWWVNWRDAL